MLTSDLKRVALRLLKALNIPEADEIKNLITHGRWDELVKVKFDPLQHHEASIDQFRRICLAQEFLRKADFLDTGIDTAAVARETFLLAEAQCKKANSHLKLFLPESHWLITDGLERRFLEVLNRARAWIAATLGPVPDCLDGSFGPGAVFESEVWCHKKSMTSYDKLRNMPSASRNLDQSIIDHLVTQTAYGSPWYDGCSTMLFTRSEGNRFTTVTKDATKDRGIAIEPGINVLGQLAVGRALRQRLKRRGLDLKGDEDRVHPVLRKLGLSVGRPWKGQALHREMARAASFSGDHATIDLTNASDTICRILVKLLLPEMWYDLLSQLRSPKTRFSPTGRKKDQRWYLLEKFSSMGNGYTFELETLIFASLAHACGGKVGVDTFVYGDDTIVPTSIAADLLAVFQYAGLTVNQAKTFYKREDLFRESCGGDYFIGHDVRPFYIKKAPNVPSDWIALANNLWHWSIKWSMPELIAVRASVLDLIPSNIRRCRGPEILGDLCIHDKEESWSVVTRGSMRFIRIWRPVLAKNYLFSKKRISVSSCFGPMKPFVVREFSEQAVALTAALVGLPSTGIAPRNSVTGYRFGTVAFS